MRLYDVKGPWMQVRVSFYAHELEGERVGALPARRIADAYLVKLGLANGWIWQATQEESNLDYLVNYSRTQDWPAGRGHL